MDGVLWRRMKNPHTYTLCLGTNEWCSSPIGPSDFWWGGWNQYEWNQIPQTRLRSFILLDCQIKTHQQTGTRNRCPITSLNPRQNFVCRRSDYMEADRAVSSKHSSKSVLQNHSHCWVNRKQRFSCGGKNKLQVLYINHEKLLSVKLGLIRSKQPDKPTMTQSEPLRSSPYRYTEIFYTSTSSPDNLVEMNHLPLAKNNTKAKRPKMEKNLKTSSVWKLKVSTELHFLITLQLFK